MIATLPKPRAILFDWDNTLVDTWPVIHEALSRTFIEVGHPVWSIEETKQRVSRSMRDAFPLIFGDDWERVGAIYQQNYQSIHLDRLMALPQAEEVLKMLKNLPLFVGVVSNKKGHNLRKEAEHLGWSGYFDALVGADDAGRDKPHPDPVHHALAKSGIEAGPEVWFIGDTAIDLSCAHNTGCTPLLYGKMAVDTLQPDGSLAYEGHAVARHVVDHAAMLEFFKSVLSV